MIQITMTMKVRSVPKDTDAARPSTDWEDLPLPIVFHVEESCRMDQLDTMVAQAIAKVEIAYKRPSTSDWMVQAMVNKMTVHKYCSLKHGRDRK